MFDSIGPGFITVGALVIGLALVAVVVSKQAQTPQVLQGLGGALAGVIGAAVSPVTGSTSYTSMFGSSGAPAAGVSQ